jgi:hypothetical protein
VRDDDEETDADLTGPKAMRVVVLGNRRREHVTAAFTRSQIPIISTPPNDAMQRDIWNWMTDHVRHRAKAAG